MKRLLTALLCLFSIVAARAEDTKVYYGYCPQTLDTQYLSAVGIKLLLKTINKAAVRINPRLKIGGILLTMVKPNTNLCKQVVNIMQVIKNYYSIKSDIGLFNAYELFGKKAPAPQDHDSLHDAVATSEVFHLFLEEITKKNNK